jgi:rubrerythrin
MQDMTAQNIKDALAGESQAHIKYLAFAEQARREGKPNVARLFEAVAYAEQVHATSHLRTLGMVGETGANVQAALAGETFEIEQMYPAYDSVAQLQGEKQAIRSINYAVAAEKQHQKYYSETAGILAGGADRDGTLVYVCPVCGHTVFGSAPDRCPVCGARGSSFKTF